ncbi:hypothetical protein PHLGIDRAFT_197588 [Phlebiopsis gigantea 11061_1 CR5-6]|uniref:Uncharacterized protein n=1 Tax=Phlebiopsis gigantea (strain 11061_1 CR5-6) TaxID=745531 RepID=A0A0C3SCD0_PHLG1|nr:hypothetical protein PHLGIDRAFT_197588 [Phlebiopsis gigantea 11061_1 CR5-6]
MAPARTLRKSSNLENMGLGLKTPSQKVLRIVSSSVFKDASIRRRNRVLSGLKASKTEDAIKHQKAATVAVRINLPTPPASPYSAAHASVQLPAQPANRLTIPNSLRRPMRCPVDSEKIVALDPEGLTNIPAGYVRASLEQLGPQMWKVVQGIAVDEFSTDQFAPEQMTVKANDVSAQMPTHLLAVWSQPKTSPSPSNRCPISLHPTHNLVLASHCTNLPTFAPKQASPQPYAPGAEISLPVQGLCVPHRESFTAIHQYLYTKDSAAFFGSLVPRPAARTLAPLLPSTSLPGFALRLSATFSTQVLLAHILFVSGVYANMCHLGIQDDEMWRVLQGAWGVLREALQISSLKSQA